jgi:hypothetical protein
MKTTTMTPFRPSPVRPRRSRRLAAAVLATLLPAGLVPAAAALPTPDASPVPAALREAIRTVEMTTRGLTAATVQSITASPADLDDPRAPRSFVVELGGQMFTGIVRPHSVRAANCVVQLQVDGGGFVPGELPPSRTWRGEVAEDPSMRLAVSIDDAGRLTGIVHDPFGETWAIEPVGDRLAGAAAHLHLVYRDVDVLPMDVRCGTNDLMRVDPPQLGRGMDVDAATMLARQNPGFDPADPDPHDLATMMARLAAAMDGAPMDGPEGGSDANAQIGFDADWEYYQLNGGSTANTIADIDTVMNAVSLIYEEQTGICYTTTGYIIRTTPADPYTGTDPVELVFQVRDEWNANVDLPHDIGHLFTGRDIDGGVIGIAFVGVVCTTSKYGLSQSRYTSNFTNRTQLTAHELGHNWNACHCNQTSCTNGAPDSDCGIMNSFVNGQTVFGSRSLFTIEFHRQTRTCLQPCVTETFVNFAWGGPENGSEAFPWNTFREGHDNATLGTEVRVTPGTSTETGVFNRNVRVVVNGTGTVRVGQQP